MPASDSSHEEEAQPYYVEAPAGAVPAQHPSTIPPQLGTPLETGTEGETRKPSSRKKEA